MARPGAAGALAPDPCKQRAKEDLFMTEAPWFIIGNRVSGSGNLDARKQAVVQALDEAKRDYQFITIDDPSEIPAKCDQAASRAREAGATLIAAGGDGTINAVAHAALSVGCRFGFLPFGTFNYASRACHLPEDVGDAARALLAGQFQPAQVGLVNGHPFLVNSSLGLYRQVIEEREGYKQALGRSRAVAYLSGLMTVLSSDEKMVLEIERDGRQELVKGSSLFVGNNATQLERIGLDQAFAIEDHQLVGILVSTTETLELLELGVRGALGQLDSGSNVQVFTFEQMTVRPREPRAGHIGVALDGEILDLPTPLHYRAAPGALQLLLPKEAVPEVAA
jgi:diacylglycerol kinase family enzyme